MGGRGAVVSLVTALTLANVAAANVRGHYDDRSLQTVRQCKARGEMVGRVLSDLLSKLLCEKPSVAFCEKLSVVEARIPSFSY